LAYCFWSVVFLLALTKLLPEQYIFNKVLAAMSAGQDIATTGLQIDIQLMRRA
jgi:hypothetical protein